MEVWYDLVGEFEYAEALEAVKRHYRAEARAIFPADIVRALDDRPDWMLR